MTNRESIFDARLGAEGRRFKFVLGGSRRPRPWRCRGARTGAPQQIKNVLYCPAYQQGIRTRGRLLPCATAIFGFQRHAYLASFSSKTLSSWALRNW